MIKITFWNNESCLLNREDGGYQCLELGLQLLRKQGWGIITVEWV